MIYDIGPRGSGKTSRLIGWAAQQTDRGENVAIVVGDNRRREMMIADLERLSLHIPGLTVLRPEDLRALMNETRIKRFRIAIDEVDDFLYAVTRTSIDYVTGTDERMQHMAPPILAPVRDRIGFPAPERRVRVR